MDRKEYKSKSQHLVTDARTGEIKRIVHPSDTDVGSSQFTANLRVFGSTNLSGSVEVHGATNLTGSLGVTGQATFVDFRSIANVPIFGQRLSLSSSVSVPSDDVPSGSTLFLTPHTSNCVSLYDTVSSTWQVGQSSSTSLALSSLTVDKNYDVFVYLSSGALALELAVWTSDTARATALTTQDGVLVKSGDKTRRYAGTIRTQATNSVPDSKSKRYVWNLYNQTLRPMSVTNSSAGWTYATTTTWRQASGSITNRVECVVGATSPVEAVVSQMISNTGASHVRVGVGIDSTTVNSAQISVGYSAGTSAINLSHAQYKGLVTAGYHAINWIEWTEAATATFYNQLSTRDPGLLASVWG